MSHSSRSSLATQSAAALAVALTFAGAAAPALAQQQQGGGGDAAPLRMPRLYQHEVGATRYSTPSTAAGGAIRFTFDRSGDRVALLRFDGDPEVHVLRPTMAAGGGEIYRTEDGNIMLRVNPHGSITVYTRTMRTGAPASEEGAVAALAPEAVAFAQMTERMRQLQAEARRNVGQPVLFTFQAPAPGPIPPQVAGLVLDAAERAAEGLAAAPMTNVHRVVITLGASPRVVVQGDLLLIQIAPQLGYAGRPSSAAVRNVVSGIVAGPEQ
ncbi:MAG: DUF4908 domain-containing protein [Terricaulis sp.]